MASSIDVEKEGSIQAKQEVNSSSYVSFHNAQIFEDGLSFSGNERNKTWINHGGRFVDLSDLSGADIPNDSRAVIAADFDDDGDVDLFVHSIQRERHALFRNDAVRPGAPGSGFLKLRLRATASQYEAIGANVVVHGPEGPTAQVLSRGAGFVSSQPPELVFGLGAQSEATVEVHWPSGARESFGVLPSGSRALLVEGSGKASAYAAHPRPLPDPLPPGLLLDEGDVLPKLAVLDGDGATRVVDLREFADGKQVFLNFWASYCQPCVKELPLLQSFEEADEIRVLAISVDATSDVQTAKDVLDDRGVSFASYFLGAPEVEGAAGVGDIVDLERLPIPMTLSISPEGRLDVIYRGPLEADAAEGGAGN